MCVFFYMWNIFGVVVFHRSMVNWRRRWSQPCMGICAFFYMWNFCSVVAFQRSMLNLRRGKGSVCHGYMCILLYMKLIWCSSFPEIYAQLEEVWGQFAISICAFFDLWHLCGVVVFQRSMLNWRRGWGQCMVYWRGYICHKYMCILLYVKCILCRGIP